MNNVLSKINPVNPVNPVKNSALPPVSSKKIIRLRKASSLTSSSLEQTNPLRGLTLAQAVSLMEATLRGEYAIPQWTLWHVEQTDPDLIALEARRSSALMEMDWNIKIADLKSRISGIDNPATAGSKIDTVLSTEQANALLEAYNRIQNLNECIEDMALAFCRGFSIAQFESSESAIRNPQSVITNLGVYMPWNIVRNGLKGDFYFNPDARSTSWQSLGDQNRIDPANHLIYTPRVSLMRIALYKFVRQNLSQKDWDAFIEIYGLPSAYIIAPPNLDDTKLAAFETAATDAAEGGSGSFPNGTDIKFATEARGVNPFRDHLKYLQEQLILAGTGGLLTMLAMPTGIGDGPTDAHSDTFKTIARADSKKISEIFQKQFDKNILSAAFPGREILAYFEIASKEEQDIGGIIEHAFKLSQAGYTMDPAQLSEKTGYKIELSAIRNPQSVIASPDPSTVPAVPPVQPAGGAQDPRPLGKTDPTSVSAGTLLNSDHKLQITNSKSDIRDLSSLDGQAVISAAVADTLGVRSDLLAPFFAKLEAKIADKSLTDAEVLDAVEAMAKQLPELMTETSVADVAKIIEPMLADALVAGAAKAEGQRLKGAEAQSENRAAETPL